MILKELNDMFPQMQDYEILIKTILDDGSIEYVELHNSLIKVIEIKQNDEYLNKIIIDVT